MNPMKSENFWLKVSAITFLVTGILGIVIQYGERTESARLISLSLFGVSGLYMFTENIIPEKKFLKSLIRMFGYPCAVVIGISVIKPLGVAWVQILGSEFDVNSAEFAEKSLYEAGWASVCCAWAMIKNLDLGLIGIIEWKYYLIGVPMLIAGVCTVRYFPEAYSDWNKDRKMNATINEHKKGVAQQRRDQNIAVATSS
tara:strand:- start:221 stop:817 length:597 start_codon:yes stop_codon:yes gene_type:complete